MAAVIAGQVPGVKGLMDAFLHPPVSVWVEPVYLADEGRTLAAASGRAPGAGLRRLMARRMAAASPAFYRAARASGGVNVRDLSLRFVLQGHRSQGIRIAGIHPVVLHRSAPLGGTLYLNQSQAGSATIRMMFDLDEVTPVARQIRGYRQDSFGELVLPGPPFFDSHTITLADGKQQTFAVRFLVTRYDVAFCLEIDYTIGFGGPVHRLLIGRHRPFQVTALHPGPEPGIVSYQRAYMRQGDYSFCEVARPGYIGTGLVAPPHCR